jgi:uncharacterized membrane protein YhiD involved in acid resistance
VSALDSLFDDYPVLDDAIESVAGAKDGQLGIDEVVIRLVAACVIGWLIGQVYRRTFTGKRFGPTLPDTHMLLCLGGALIWLVVGNNIVRAFGLAGTIGLIRYRTVVRDPKDTTILLFSMIMGMACGLGQLAVAILGTIVVLNVLILLHYRHRKAQAHQAKKSADLLDLLDTGGKSKKRKKPEKE